MSLHLPPLNKYLFLFPLLFLPNVIDAASKEKMKYITFLLKKKLILIDVIVDDEQGYFLLDTGMDDIVLNRTYFEGIPSNQSVTGLNQEVSNLETTMVNLEMGNITFPGTHGKIIDLSFLEHYSGEKVMGVCGIRLLQKYEWIIHYRKGVIELFSLDRKGVPLSQNKDLPSETLPLRKKRHLLFVEAKLDHQTLMLGIDTGASITLIDDKNILSTNYKVGNQCRVQGVDGNIIISESGILENLEIGRIKLARIRISRTSLQYIDQKSFNISIDGIFNPVNLGCGIIGINWKQKLLYIWDDSQKEKDIIIAELVEY